MKDRLLIFSKYALIWLSFLIFAKLLFLVVNFSLSKEHFLLWPKIIIKGFLLDLSMLGYVMILPTLLLFINSILKGKWFATTLKIYTWFILIVFSFVMIADLVIYPDWGFRLDITPLYYMKNMDEAFASVSIIALVFFLILTIAIPIPFIYLFNRYLKNHYLGLTKRSYWGLPVFLFLFAFLFLPIRGGLGTAPINTGSVYFHENSFVNHACLNLPWYIIYSITNTDDYKNPFLFYPENIEIPKKLDSVKKDKYRVISTERPNVLMILLESITSNVVGSLNDEISATPNLDTIISNGLLFNNFYASGDRSDKGIVSILSAYPSLPTTAIIKYPNKTEKLPGLARSLSKKGYHTKFYYGGDIDFANMRSYVLNCGFQEIISQNNFPAKKRMSSWGVPDEYLFEKLYQEISESNEPYFKVAFTLSSHRPFDVPEPEKYFKETDNNSPFLNSVGYTDNKLGQFISKLESENKLENTLLILVADHGSSIPGNHQHNSPKKYHIPMVWYGPALKDSLKGKENSSYAGQTDIASMLLGQLGIDDSEYIFSRDIFQVQHLNETYYTFHKGFGFLSDSIQYKFSSVNNKFQYILGSQNDSIEILGKQYYQNLYTHFLSLQ